MNKGKNAQSEILIVFTCFSKIHILEEIKKQFLGLAKYLIKPLTNCVTMEKFFNYCDVCFLIYKF